MNRTAVIAAAVVASISAVAGAYWLGKSSTQAATAQSKPAAAPNAAKSGPVPAGVSVEVAKVVTAKLAKSITAVGSLRSDESIIVRPEVSGRVSEILFREGQRVEKGAALVRIDDSVQRAELEQAKANLSLGKSKLDRALDLQKKGFISSQAREEAENNFRVSQAAFDLASARLTKLEIRAPFSGLVGLRQVSVGDYIKDGQDIANLEGIDSLKVDFRVPEIYLKQVAVNQTLQVTLDALPDKTIVGRVLAINPLLDANGRSIVVRALVQNADARLRPGMFARVRLLTAESAESMTVPEQALIPVADEVYVFRVVDGKALRTRVEIGQRQAGVVEVTRGLAPGDLVVTAGQIKIRDGSAVQIASSPRDEAPRPAAKDAPAGLVPAAKKT